MVGPVSGGVWGCYVYMSPDYLCIFFSVSYNAFVYGRYRKS